jgi:glycosyltransferase involved in cell wall biosynthesis
MDLTICLITKGRLEYLDPLLESLSEALKNDWVKILIVLNGAPKEVEDRIRDWSEGKSRIIIEIRLENDSRQSVQWQSVKKHAVGWCNFISDDDILNAEILPEILKLHESNSDLVAISTSIEVIDSRGIKTGEVKSPYYEAESTSAKNLAMAFHRPNFPWPSLFFDIRSLPEILPNSRYAFDWLICLHLIANGKIAVIQSPGVLYRVHDGQESSVSSNRRKYFEALFWINDFTKSRSFEVWLDSLTEAETEEFWSTFVNLKPIYGDLAFYPFVLNSIAQTFLSNGNRKWTEIVNKEFALSTGVLLRNSEYIHIEKEMISKNTFGNFSLLINPDSCLILLNLSKFFSAESNSLSIEVGCKHVRSRHRGLILECERYKNLEPDQQADLVVSQITILLEQLGQFGMTLSPVEMGIVQKYRSIKSRLPNKLLSKFKSGFRKFFAN